MDDGALFGASRQWGSIRAKINAEVFKNETTSRENGRKLFLFVRHGEAAHNLWGERQKGEAPMPNEQVPCTDEVTEVVARSEFNASRFARSHGER